MPSRPYALKADLVSALLAITRDTSRNRVPVAALFRALQDYLLHIRAVINKRIASKNGNAISMIVLREVCRRHSAISSCR